MRLMGIPVSLTEHLDALEALRRLPLGDRELVREGLACTLVKRDSHRDAFDLAFDIYFSLRAGEGSLGPGDDLTGAELADLLWEALSSGDPELMRAAAQAAVSQYAGWEPGRPLGGAYYLQRTLRHLDTDGLLARLLAQLAGQGPPSPFDVTLAEGEAQGRLARLRGEMEADIRHKLVDDQGPDAVAKALRRALPEEVDFMHATREELAALRRALGPLTRKLASRLAARRRHRRRGSLDFRSTVRHSLSSGGVPLEPRFRHPRATKPEIMVVADVSGSVAAFARFTLQLVYAISAQFSRVRSFAFIDGIDEVTSYFDGGADIATAIQRVSAEADVVASEGHSDYGRALELFWNRWGKEVTGRTTVLILGDGRNNYHAPGTWALAEIAAKARRLYWLNPEPRSYWDTGDSIVGQYAPLCDGMWECRNLAQLERFVEALA
ncbi:MAG: vWA domain-containing protein [Acidimicrobiales bacterium]